jgi:hypothetical protein
MIRRLLLLLSLLAFLPAGPTAAQESGGFRIETITVEGGRRAATEKIVLAESRLTAGREWTESDLRDAIYRIRRLPFIVRADFALRRGTARGLYTLAITVEETRPFVFSRELEVVSFAQESASIALGYGSGHVDAHSSGSAGVRLFVGSQGVLFGALTAYEGWQVGFTRYDLFGRGGSATLAWESRRCCLHQVLPLALDPDFTMWSDREADQASLSLAVPLTGNHSLRAAASVLRGRAESRSGVLADYRSFQPFLDETPPRELRQAQVAWFYDTADDPLFPAHGVTVSAGVELSEHRAPAREGGLFDTASSGPETDARLVALATTARRNWSLSPRQAVSLGGRLAVGRSRLENPVTGGHIERGTFDADSLESSLEARWSASLWGFERTRDQGDLRFEVAARYGLESVSPGFGGAVRQLAVTPSIVFRNGWGVFRFGFGYLSFQRSGR